MSVQPCNHCSWPALSPWHIRQKPGYCVNCSLAGVPDLVEKIEAQAARIAELEAQAERHDIARRVLAEVLGSPCHADALLEIANREET